MIEQALVISNGHRIELDGTALGDEPPTLHLHEQIIDARGKPIYIMERVHLTYCELITPNVVFAGDHCVMRNCRITTLMRL